MAKRKARTHKTETVTYMSPRRAGSQHRNRKYVATMKRQAEALDLTALARELAVA